MNELKAIETANGMEPLEKLRYYMDYFIRSRIIFYTSSSCLTPLTFNDFCSEKNIIKHNVGEGWNKTREIAGIHGFKFNCGGYASQSWINFSAGSIFHSIYHGLK